MLLSRQLGLSARLRWTATAACAVALTGLAFLPAAQAAVRTPAGHAIPAATSVKPGLTGPAIVVANNAEFSGYDLATGPNGTAYLGWIGDTGSGRMVSLCTLPPGAKGCAGGIKTIAAAPDSIGASQASGLQVLVGKSNVVTLVWMHPTIASENGPEGDKIAIATSAGGGKLSAESDVSAAPSFGYFLDAALAPNGKIWTVTNPTGASSDVVQITKGLGTAPQTVKTPFWPGQAEIAFSGPKAVIAIDKDGTITQPVYTATQSGSGWTGFKAIARTWDVSGFGMAETTSGLRLITTENNADYHPVVSRLTAAGWSTPALTGDNTNCSPGSHDVVADASGRLADVSEECASDVTVANLADTRHAALFRFSIGDGTFAGGSPQLTTSPSGRGWVAWSVESAAGNRLLVAPLVLAGLDVSASWSGKPGKVTVTGPASCLPPVNVPVGVAGKAASGWTVAAKSLKLGGSAVGSVLKGAGLAAGKKYTLTGTVTFASGSARATGKASLTFRTCPKP